MMMKTYSKSPAQASTSIKAYPETLNFVDVEKSNNSNRIEHNNADREFTETQKFPIIGEVGVFEYPEKQIGDLKSNCCQPKSNDQSNLAKLDISLAKCTALRKQGKGINGPRTNPIPESHRNNRKRDSEDPPHEDPPDTSPPPKKRQKVSGDRIQVSSSTAKPHAEPDQSVIPSMRIGCELDDQEGLANNLCFKLSTTSLVHSSQK